MESVLHLTDIRVRNPNPVGKPFEIEMKCCTSNEKSFYIITALTPVLLQPICATPSHRSSRQ